MKCKEYLLIGLILISLNAYAEKAIFKGRILDRSSNEPIAFANIGIIGTNRGTSSDLQGYFNISLSKGSGVSLIISCIGYQSRVIKAREGQTNDEKLILLHPKIYELEEIIVTSVKIPVLDLLLKATENIPQNYYPQDFSFDIFSSRELRDFENNSPILQEDIVAEGFYKKGYSPRKSAHAGGNSYFKIVHRTINGQEQKYTNYDYGLFTGYGLVILDVIRHKNSPLAKNNLKDFDFRLDSVTSNEYDTIYNVSFVSKKTDYKNSGIMAGKKYQGAMSISLPTYAITRYEGEILLDKNERFTNQRDFIDDPKLYFIVTYSKVGERYVFDYVKSSMLIYDGSNRLKFDQEFLPYNFELDKPRTLAESHLGIDVDSDSNFWKTYKRPARKNY